jgi:hypothetical protein
MMDSRQVIAIRVDTDYSVHCLVLFGDRASSGWYLATRRRFYEAVTAID